MLVTDVQAPEHPHVTMRTQVRQRSKDQASHDAASRQPYGNVTHVLGGTNGYSLVTARAEPQETSR